MTARIGVITFPGTLDDVDASRAVRYHRMAWTRHATSPMTSVVSITGRVQFARFAGLVNVTNALPSHRTPVSVSDRRMYSAVQVCIGAPQAGWMAWPTYSIIQIVILCMTEFEIPACDD